jgi:Fe-S-cluster containining protein
MAQRGCVRCGKCCLIWGMKAQDDGQYELFNRLHGMIYEDDGDHLLMQARCQAVGFDLEGRAHCVIYDERPQLCRDYLCDAARAEVAGDDGHH